MSASPRDDSGGWASPGGRTIRVLSLEDSARDFELISAALLSAGLQVEMRSVVDAAGFAGVLGEGWPDLILSDFSLPGYDGLAALETAQRSCPEVPFIFVTGALGEEVAIETLRRGATDYVLKDRIERLVPAVNRALKEAEERARRRRLEAERDQLLAREREARREAEAANRMKDEFIAMISHELRTPLNAMVGWLRLLKTGALPEEKRAKALETIERNANIQVQLVDDLLEISRIVAGNIRLDVTTVDATGVVNAAVESLWPVAERKGVRLEVQHEVDLPLVDGDAQRLQQIVWNLVSNALKFTAPGGRVSVRVDRHGAQVGIAVTDDGEGIAPEFLPYVFDRFRQADGGRDRRHGGLGLGLAIVRHLVELHGGQVTATSGGLGTGSTFTVLLPGATGTALCRHRDGAVAAVIAREIQAADSALLNGVRVIVVDDDDDARDLVTTFLAQWGASVRSASSTVAAMAEVQRDAPHVLVCDIAMPGEDGYSFIKRLRERTEGSPAAIPALALTAYARYEDRLQALAAGFDRHLAKPVDPRELAKVVADLAGQRADPNRSASATRPRARGAPEPA